MKVLITGSKGQLGQELVKQFKEQSFDVFPFTKEELDITDEKKVDQIISDIKPGIILNAAAYTKVDMAETEEELAYNINAFGQRNLTVAAEKVNAKICYVSTDYVFDGSANSPYKAYETCKPLGVYGNSKYVGEKLTQSLSTKYFIVRTAWVYGEYGQNFVKTMLTLADNRNEIGVVADQVGSPTYTADLADFIIALVQTEKYGIYHGTNSGTCSWFEFAKAIFEDYGIHVKVNPLTTEEFPRPAERPKYSVLDNMTLRVNGFKPFPPWRESLKAFLKNYKK